MNTIAMILCVIASNTENKESVFGLILSLIWLVLGVIIIFSEPLPVYVVTSP